MYVMVIAEKSGWTENFIRWHLPLSRGRAYYHAARVLAGVPMRWPEEGERNEEWFTGVKAKIRKRLEATRRKRKQ